LRAGVIFEVTGFSNIKDDMGSMEETAEDTILV
jgi:hypothetical protein